MATASALLTADDLLAAERRARRQGSGLTRAQLSGRWRLERTWGRSGTPPAPGSGAALRWLRACLILETQGDQFVITNQVSLASLRLRFRGTADLKGRRPLLLFIFSRLEVALAEHILFSKHLPTPKPQRMPFFALIGIDDAHGQLTARGRGGGLALWVRENDDRS